MTEAGVRLSVTVDGADAIGRALVALQMRGENLHPALEEIGASLLTSTQRRFEDEAGPDGQPWAPTKRGGAILRDSARLYQSITYEASRSSVEIGSNVVYARIHQLGGQTGRGHAVTMPARPYLGVDDEDRQEVLAIIQDYIRGPLS